jgi:hypothetical protein
MDRHDRVVFIKRCIEEDRNICMICRTPVMHIAQAVICKVDTTQAFQVSNLCLKHAACKRTKISRVFSRQRTFDDVVAESDELEHLVEVMMVARPPQLCSLCSETWVGAEFDDLCLDTRNKVCHRKCRDLRDRTDTSGATKIDA